MKASKKVGFRPVDVRKTREQILKEEKLLRIVNRVQAEITPEQREQMIMTDHKLRNLHIDKEKALKAGKLFSVNIYQNQIEKRIEDMVYEKTAEIILNLIRDGEIMRYLDDEDMRKLLNYRIRTIMLLDAVDSSFKDMSDVLHSVGLDGDLIVASEITKARESIEQYIKFNTSGNTDELRQMMLEDADRVYDFAGKRVPVLDRKINRLMEKKAKEAEKQKEVND